MAGKNRARRSVDPSIELDESGNLAVTLIGAQCANCHEVVFRASATCPNCGSSDMQRTPLSRTGTLWTYTVCHHRPPGSRRLPESAPPFALGLVELDEGVRILAPIEVDADQLAIGLQLELRPLPLTGDTLDEDLIGYAFGPPRPGAGA